MRHAARLLFLLALAVALCPRPVLADDPNGRSFALGNDVFDKENGRVSAVNNEYWRMKEYGHTVFFCYSNSLGPLGVDKLTLKICKSDGSFGGYGMLYGNEVPFKSIDYKIQPQWHFYWDKLDFEPGYYNLYIYANGEKWAESKLHLVNE